MKRRYKGECGFTLPRGKLTRPQFAQAKVKHAIDTDCASCKKLIERSRKKAA